MSYPAISLATATVGRYRCPQKRLQTARQPPVYPNSSPRIIAPVTPSPPSAALTPSIPVHRWIRVKEEKHGKRDNVEIEGRIDPNSIVTTTTTTVSSFSINGGRITVVLDGDTRVKGRIRGGAQVKIEGTVQADHSILAETVKVE